MIPAEEMQAGGAQVERDGAEPDQPEQQQRQPVRVPVGPDAAAQRGQLGERPACVGFWACRRRLRASAILRWRAFRCCPVRGDVFVHEPSPSVGISFA